MSRVALIHWHVEEAERGRERLRRAGHTTELLDAREGPAGLRLTRDEPPEAFVIDLGRMPATGQAIGISLRQRKATRRVPVVFVDGDAAKVARVRRLLPDATYSSWRRIRGDLRRALAHPPVDPVVPGMMDGYSGTPLPKKLGIKSGSTVFLLDAPSRFETTLDPLPPDVRLIRRLAGRPQIILLFARSVADLERRFPAAARALADGGVLWMIWPKQASGVKTDLTQVSVRALGLRSGFVDYKICAVDSTWSGLCFARRKK